MDYREKLSCKRDGELTIPVKLIAKGSALIDVARCPKCNKSYKFLLSTGEKEQWLPYIKESFPKCLICGFNNKDNMEYGGESRTYWHPYWYWMNMHNERLKIKITCQNCNKKQAKVITADLYADITKDLEKTPAKPSGELRCPHCDATIAFDDKFCPSCKKAIVCDSCSRPIAPNAKFCASCGDKVEIYDSAVDTGAPRGNLCPTCGQPFREGEVFCSVCGQELICDKCGHDLREGALFCVNCGDAVTKGDLSE